MIAYFKDKNHKCKKNYKKYRMITTMLKSFDTFFIIATTSSSTTLSLTGIGLIAIPISIATACGLSISIKVIYAIIMQKYDKYKKNMKKINQQLNLSINYTAKVYKKMKFIKMNMNLYVIFLLNN